MNDKELIDGILKAGKDLVDEVRKEEPLDRHGNPFANNLAFEKFEKMINTAVFEARPG